VRELTRMDRLWLAAQAHGGIKLVIPAAAKERLRQFDLITTRHDRSVSLTRLGQRLALRLKQQMRLSRGEPCAGTS
jgi:hypothetical protein